MKGVCGQRPTCHVSMLMYACISAQDREGTCCSLVVGFCPEPSKTKRRNPIDTRQIAAWGGVGDGVNPLWVYFHVGCQLLDIFIYIYTYIIMYICIYIYQQYMCSYVFVCIHMHPYVSICILLASVCTHVYPHASCVSVRRPCGIIWAHGLSEKVQTQINV